MPVFCLFERRCHYVGRAYVNHLTVIQIGSYNHFSHQKQFYCAILRSFILDRMNSVEIAELNNTFDVFISVWKRRNGLRVKNVSILLFRSVWNFQQVRPEVIERLRMKTLYWKFRFV